MYEEAEANFAKFVISVGVNKSKKLPQGIKQGPAIYQHLQDDAFDPEYEPNVDKLCVICSMPRTQTTIVPTNMLLRFAEL